MPTLSAGVRDSVVGGRVCRWQVRSNFQGEGVPPREGGPSSTTGTPQAAALTGVPGEKGDLAVSLTLERQAARPGP